MSQVEKYKQAVKLLEEINCPKPILDALWVFGMTVRADEVKLHNWQALANGQIVEGEAREISEHENRP